MRLLLTIAIVTVSAVASHANWPAFRGERASGSASATLPTAWNAATGAGIRWRTPIVGLSHASPIAWGGRVYVLASVAPGSALDTRAEGVVFARDTIEHEWRLHCLDAETGRQLWMRVLHTGTPRQPRHVKGTYANATPATDGRHIAAVLGNEGLFVTDMDGRLLWRKEMAPSNPGWSLDAASSPVIVGDLVIVQNDWRQEGFAAAYELSGGRERWRVPRSEGLSWSTPGVWPLRAGRPQVVFNSPRWIRAHDVLDGREMWRLDNSTEGPYDRVPTPVEAGDLMLVAGGGGHRPIFAVRTSAAGDITPKAGEPAAAIAWVTDRASPYLPTPLVHRGLVYVCGNAGVLSVYRVADGSMAYRVRVAPDAGAFSASPIGAGDHVYLASEDGEVFVVAAGDTFRLLARNPMGAPLFATPAIAGTRLIVRTAGEVFGL